MSTQQWPSKVVPAQLSFLAIYNPLLGPTEETFQDQVVFYHSRRAHEARLAAKKSARNDAAGGDALRQEENEMLRHIGFAQGTVDFARSFSGGEPVNSIETEKSRIVLQELEKGWWILASVDLTRLPAISQSSSSESSKKGAEKQEAKRTVEYSSRDVSPPTLLVQQLLQAHSIFSLHHGPSLSDLFVRLERDKFCSTLDRFWNRFCRSWDVLLHGNPAVDIFSGLKLASGGELGFGVGEEEWGSGERAVLEDLAHRTEGLIDLVVSRFGEPAAVDEEKTTLEDEAMPWMGGGNKPIASDGVIFSGIGALERHSLRNISLWMRQIYTYGEYAYGVRDNPLREPRKRRKRNPPEQGNGKIDYSRSSSRQLKPKPRGQNVAQTQTSTASETIEGPGGLRLPVDKRPEMHPRSQIASYDHTTTPEETPTPREDPDRPAVPPPIVTAAEQALHQATQSAERKQKGVIQDVPAIEDAGTTLGIPDQYMKYLTFGLSTLAKPAAKTDKQPSRRVSTASSQPVQTSSKHDSSAQLMSQNTNQEEEEEDRPFLTHLEPMPDGETLKSKIEAQKRKENRGHFVIGLKGDLTELDELSDDDDTDVTEGSFEDDGSRIVLRTIQVELSPKDDVYQEIREAPSTKNSGEEVFMTETLNQTRRLRVLVYVHRPFMYCFLFENRASALQLTKFYKSLHRNLVPIHKPLLSSTNAAKVAQRIDDSHAADMEDYTSVSDSSNKLPSKGVSSLPIYNLIYDPVLLKLHTSIPNIPEPGTPAAEGIFSGFSKSAEPPSWTRVEALNVHSQILNTLVSVRNRKTEVERTSKTTRGWWVVWMKVAPSTEHAHSDEHHGDKSTVTQASSNNQNLSTTADDQKQAVDTHRIAFLVRKSSETPVAVKSPPSAGSKAMTSMLGAMSLGMAGSSRNEDATGGANAGWGPAALGGGIGVDARRYVEGLLSLNR